MKVIVKNEEVLCPHCKKYLFDEDFIWDFKDYKYCPYCGKKIIVERSQNNGRIFT